MNVFTLTTLVMTAVVMMSFANHVVEAIYGGRECIDGETVMASDGCNTCMCRNGRIRGCTRMACPPRGCNYKGVTYAVGESFKDDCNTCTCGENGNVGCSYMACPRCNYKGVTYAVGESFKDDCNTCTCGENGNAGCTYMACPGGGY